MQLKSILLLTCLLFTGSVFAQHPVKNSHYGTRVTQVDTIVVRKGTVPAPTMAGAPAAADKKPAQKKTVPLANEKAYYGAQSDYVADFVRKYLQVHYRTLNYVQGKSDNSFSIIDNVLKQHDIPKELKYLAVIESALNHNAVSRAGAVGPWQLMSSTARLMGLTVSRKRDDRRDWYKSTNAAAKYLSILYENLNDWLLVVAAYNSGPAPVMRAINRTGSRNFWDIKQYLPKETQGHVLAFIATATIFENLSSFLGLSEAPDEIKSMDKSLPAGVAPVNAPATAPGIVADKKPAKTQFTEEELKNMAIVKLSEPMSMDLLVQELKVDKKLLTRWNPDYDMYEMGIYSYETYSFRLPKDKLDYFLEKKEFLQKRSRQVLSAQNM